MSSFQRQQILDHYESRIDTSRENYDVLDWASRDAQQIRFRVLAEVLDKIRNRSSGEVSEKRLCLLDAGCGFGELATFLEEQSLPVDYTGIDLCAGFLRAAKKVKPELQLAVGDVFRQAPFQKAGFEIVFCSGTLNLETQEHDAFVQQALASMFSLCHRAVIVNFLHARTPNQYEHCHYYEPSRVIKLLPQEVVKPVTVIDDYLENDFTLIVEKNKLKRKDNNT